MGKRKEQGYSIGKLDKIIVSQGWVSDGHWAVDLDLVRPSERMALLAGEAAINAVWPNAQVCQADIHAVLNLPSEPITYYRTRWLSEEKGGDYVLFRSPEGFQAWINRQYVKQFSLEVLIGSSYGGTWACSKDALFHLAPDGETILLVVMPGVCDGLPLDGPKELTYDPRLQLRTTFEKLERMSIEELHRWNAKAA